MKNIYLILISLWVMSISCVNDSSPQVIGSSYNQDGEKSDVVAGPDNIVGVWETYIDAHNSRDVDGIRALNADVFSAYGSAGEVVEGSDAHIEFLSQWFEANNPRWKINWAISNTGESLDGTISDYVTAGHEVTLNVDGEDITLYQVIDAMIADGKVVTFNVFQQERGQPSSE